MTVADQRRGRFKNKRKFQKQNFVLLQMGEWPIQLTRLLSTPHHAKVEEPLPFPSCYQRQQNFFSKTDFWLNVMNLPHTFISFPFRIKNTQNHKDNDFGREDTRREKI